jgi:hypothetical protein
LSLPFSSSAFSVQEDNANAITSTPSSSTTSLDSKHSSSTTETQLKPIQPPVDGYLSHVVLSKHHLLLFTDTRIILVDFSLGKGGESQLAGPTFMTPLSPSTTTSSIMAPLSSSSSSLMTPLPSSSFVSSPPPLLSALSSVSHNDHLLGFNTRALWPDPIAGFTIHESWSIPYPNLLEVLVEDSKEVRLCRRDSSSSKSYVSFVANILSTSQLDLLVNKLKALRFGVLRPPRPSQIAAKRDQILSSPKKALLPKPNKPEFFKSAQRYMSTVFDEMRDVVLNRWVCRFSVRLSFVRVVSSLPFLSCVFVASQQGFKEDESSSRKIQK